MCNGDGESCTHSQTVCWAKMTICNKFNKMEKIYIENIKTS